MKNELVESVSNAVPEPTQESNTIVELVASELTAATGGIRAIGLITVDK